MPERINESLSALMDGEADELEIRRILNSCDKDPSVYESWRRLQMVRSALRDEPISNVDLSAGIRQALNGLPMDEVPADADQYHEMTQADVAVGIVSKVVDTSAHGNPRASAPAVTPVNEQGQESQIASDDVMLTQTANLGFAALAKISMVAAAVGLMSAFLVIESSNHLASTVPMVAGSDIRTSNYPMDEAGNLPTRTMVADTATVKVSSFSKMSVDDASIDRRLDAYFLHHAEFSSLNTGRGLMPFARMDSGQSTTRR